MFDVPLDALYAWFGVAAVSLAVVGVAAAIPATPVADAADAATTVDAVAAGEHPSTAEHGLAADEMKLTPSRIALRNDRGTRRSTFAFGPVTPVRSDERLGRVLAGEPPDRVFESKTAFQQAMIETRTADPGWERAPERLRIRQVHWGEIRVTLLG